MSTAHRAAALGLAACLSGAGGAASEPPTDWAPLDAVVRAQIAAGQMPGAVAIVGDAEGIWLRRAWGARALHPREEEMTADTIFDLASLTKVVCTTTAALQLADAGRLPLDARVEALWPGFGAHGKDAITVRQLLSHSSGLRPDLSWAPGEDAAALQDKLFAEAPVAPPGTTRIYSDINFIVLGRLVERTTGEGLDRYCRRHVFEPLHMHDTSFRPGLLHRWRIAPTERVDGRWLRGQVHDPSARRMGGVAGHAGLFGTADDLARFAQALLSPDASGVLSPQMLRIMQQPTGPETTSAWQGLGWELEAPLVAARERLAPVGTVTHTGFTGTALWIDFVQRRFVILLASRLHGHAGDARPLRRETVALVSSLAAPLPQETIVQRDAAWAAAVARRPRPVTAGPAVHTGIDVLRDSGYAALQGRRVALLTHLAAMDRHGWRTLDRLRWAPGVALVRVFTPEHGLYGDLEGSVPSGVEAFSGVPVTSLYGGERWPPPASLQDIDALVVDLQDAGARFFTYVSTLGEAMQAAARAGVRVVVLDRPDPVGADRVSGPMLDPALLSFTGFAPMPVQHGLTFGEMARFLHAWLREQRGVDVDLQVVAMQGYRRGMRFADTGLDWVPPSPNLRRPSTALLYPGASWVEGANVSVGRGTQHPFEWIGAPWIRGRRLAEALRSAHLPGVAIEPVRFVPAAPPFDGQACGAVALRVTDAHAFDAPLLGAALVASLWRLWPQAFRIDRTLGMIGSAAAVQALRDGVPLAVLAQRWEAERADFMAARERALLYARD